jgi:L-gulonolactone oxidase
MTSLYQPNLTTSQLQSISNEEIERILQEQRVNVPKGSKEGTFQNWAKTFKCVPERVFKPETPDQVLLITTLARRLDKPVRAAAIGHSPSDLACTSAWQILMTGFDRPISVSPSPASPSGDSNGPSGGKGGSIAHVQAGMTLNALHRWLAQNDLAMTNCGSIDAQSLGGTIVTCTHGSGWDFGVLTETVREVGVVVAGGDSQGEAKGEGEVRLVRCSKDVEPDLFNATM